MAIYRYSNVPNAGVSLKVKERPVYGSSRIGSYAREREMYGLDLLVQPTTYVNIVAPMQASKQQYELTDHLGNITAVVTAQLLPGNGAGSAWQPALLSAQGYEPFGSLLPGRSYSSGSYRYLFQGQEHDDEINGAPGTSYAFEYRMHDPRIGRFLSIDPLAGKYPFWTPYAFSGNRVIDAFEYEGLEPVVKSFTYGSSPAPYWFVSDERTPQKFTIEDGDEPVGGFDFAGDAGGSSLALVRGNDCCQRPDPSNGTASHDVNYLLDARITVRYQSVPVLSLLQAAMNQNPDLKLAIVGNHKIPRDPMLNQGQLLYSRDQLDAQPSLGNDFTKLRADFVRSDFFGGFNNVDTYSRNDVDYSNNPNARWPLFPRSVAMPGLGDDARGITMLFDFRGIQSTPRGSQPDATPVDPDTRYRNVRHL